MPRPILATCALAMAAMTADAAWAEAAPVDQVIAAERAFAHDGKTMGWIDAFKKYAAPDAIVFRPGPVNAQANMAGKASKPGEPTLAWWPLWAGAARSGDLGFTTGAATYDSKPISHYFTVWKKQADGSWKWEFDGGVDESEASPAGPDTEPLQLDRATASAGSADKAMEQVMAAEESLAAAAKADQGGAYRATLSDQARTIGFTALQDVGPPAYGAVLLKRSKTAEFKTLGGGASQAGDMAWTYGEAHWQADGKAASGHYVRVWQDTREGWKIVYDQLYPDPPAS